MSGMGVDVQHIVKKTKILIVTCFRVVLFEYPLR